jgi:hypothetical protein
MNLINNPQRSAAGRADKRKMKIKSKDFRVRRGEKVKLKEWPTMVKPF